jgi:hypothetical protein
MKIRGLQWAHPLVFSQRVCYGHAVVSLMIIRSLQLAHTLGSRRICNGHAVTSLIVIRSLHWAHTLVCFPSHFQRPCRCFSDNNSELPVGTHVGVFFFRRIGNGHAVASLIIETHGVGFVSLERDPLRGLYSFSVYEEIPILQIPAGQMKSIGHIR